MPVTIDFATANGTAIGGSDYVATSGTITFAPGVTTRTILVPTLDDAAQETIETFDVILSDASGATITGTATILDDDAPPTATKFFVVDAGSDQTYEYDSSGGALSSDDWNLDSGNTNSRGATANGSGSLVWVVDTNDRVYVYDGDGALQGSWVSSGLARAEGIATDDVDLWILDGQNEVVLRFTGGAGFLSGTHAADSSFALASVNDNPSGITTDGTNVWVLDDDKQGDDNVWRYTVSGTFEGGWSLDSANKKPKGLTIDPTGQSQSIWVVDAGADKVFEYANARGTSGGTLAGTFDLAAGNTNPQGIADPPPASLPLLPSESHPEAEWHSTIPATLDLSDATSTPLPDDENDDPAPGLALGEQQSLGFDFNVTVLDNEDEEDALRPSDATHAANDSTHLNDPFATLSSPAMDQATHAALVMRLWDAEESTEAWNELFAQLGEEDLTESGEE